MFADTESGAIASGRVFSVIETALANGHNPPTLSKCAFSRITECGIR